MIKSCFSAYILFNLEYCAPVWTSSAEAHLSLLDSVARSAEILCKGELCYLGNRRMVSALWLLYKIYYRADHFLHEYVHHFDTARNIRVSATLCQVALVIPRCRTSQFSSFFYLCCYGICITYTITAYATDHGDFPYQMQLRSSTEQPFPPCLLPKQPPTSETM